MGAFGGITLTDKGRNLQTKAQTGVQLEYTRIGVGDGELAEQSILTLSGLISEKKSLAISKLKLQTAGQAVIGTVLSNQDVTSGFYFREIGIFATDPDEGEILYGYGNAGAGAEYIPAAGGADLIEKEIDMIVVVGQAQNVSAVIDGSLVWATKDDVAAAVQEAQAMVDEVKEYADTHIKDVETSDLTLPIGTSAHEVDHDTPLKIDNVQGRTLINRMGRVGALESATDWLVYSGSMTVANNEASVTSDTTGVNPQIFNFNIGAVPAVGDKLFFRGRAMSDTALSFFRISLYDNVATKFYAFADKTDVNINQYYDIACVVDVTQEMIDNWANVSIRIASYYPEAIDGAISKFSQLAIYHIPSNTTGTADEIASLYIYVDGMTNVKNPYVQITDESQQKSISAFECDLAANPLDGSNADFLFISDDGLPYKSEKWTTVNLGDYSGWVFRNKLTSVTSVRLPSGTFPISTAETNTYVTNHRGESLSQVTTSTDTEGYGHTADGLYRIHVLNTDTGWGDAYSPTEDEIRAYFLGWKMYEGDSGDVTTSYNGTGTKAWVPLDGRNGTVGSYYLTSVPTESITEYSYTRFSVWNPYKLQYLKSTPTTVPVQNYELGATLNRGSNIVEVGSGIVIREKVNPVQSVSGNLRWYLYTVGISGGSSKPSNNLRKIDKIYRNGMIDNTWVIYDGSIDKDYGLQDAYCENSNYDSSATYHVTYTMLDPTIPSAFNGKVSSNLRGTLSDTVQNVADLQRQVSVLTNHKAEKDQPQWITPTLLNGYTAFDIVAYWKDSMGYVHCKGRLEAGGATTAYGTKIWAFPKGYRPSSTFYCYGATWNSDTDKAPLPLMVESNGDVTLVLGAKNGLVFNFSFLASE